MFLSNALIFQHHIHRFHKICNFQNIWKIAHLGIKSSPKWWQIDKNQLTSKREIIFRRFWILIQIFCSLFRSRDVEHSLDTTISRFYQKAMFLEIAYMRGFFNIMNRSNDENQVSVSKGKFSVESEYLTRIVITLRDFELCVDISTPHSLFS